MNKWLYKHMYVIYAILASFRMSWYIFTGQKKKSKDIILEHMNW